MVARPRSIACCRRCRSDANQQPHHRPEPPSGDIRSRPGAAPEPLPGLERSISPRSRAGGASMRPGGQVKRSSRDVTAARRDPGRGSARAPYPQAGRPAALHPVLHRDRRAGPGRRGGQRDHGRRAGRHRGRHQAGTGLAARRGPPAGVYRPVHPARGPGRPAPGPAPVPAARRVGRHRRPGRRRDRRSSTCCSAGSPPVGSTTRSPWPARARARGQPHPRPGPRPGGPGRLRHHGRPRRSAGLAERAVGGGRRVLRRARGRAAHADADPADHGDRGPRDRPGGPVRRGLHLGAARRPGHRLRAQSRRAAGPRDQAGPDSTAPGRPGPVTTR